jgi:excisionase family DNA binding protein
MENSILIRNITAEELQELIRSVIKEELQILLPKRGESRNLTRNEVAAFLKISLPTLQRYTQLGVIKGFRIGTRILYKLEDIEESLKSIETSRYRR